MRIDPHISGYIDIAIERERKIFDGNMKKQFEAGFLEMDKRTASYMAIQREILQDDIKKIAEMVGGMPNRDEIRDIVREEISVELKPIKIELSMFREELLDHRARLAHLERAS